MPTKILVTGAFGYVGGRLCEALALSDAFDLTAAVFRTENRTNPDWAQHANVVQLDVLGPADDLAAACRGVDCVVHLAGSNEIVSASNTAHAMDLDGGGTLALLQAAVEAGVERFIYLSTIHVYGAPLVGTITEDTLPRPLHPYAILHRLAEDFVLAAHARGEIEGLVLRLSNATGAPTHMDIDRWTLAGNDFCQQAVRSNRIVLKSAGLQVRDFIPMADAVAGLTHAITLPIDSFGTGLFNLGGKTSLRIIDLAERVCDSVLARTNRRPTIERPKPDPEAVPMHLDYCIDKLLTTGFALTGDIGAEIDRTVELCIKAADPPN